MARPTSRGAGLLGKRGDGYGSEYHLHRYLDGNPDAINARLGASGLSPSEIVWLDFPLTAAGKECEFARLEFLPQPEFAAVRADWTNYWPTRGKGQTWDAIGKAGDTWLLVEAKANKPEFCTPPSGATGKSRKLIEKTLSKVKSALGVHCDFSWTGSYYQHANRLAVLWFMRFKHGIDARLVSIYFTGDVFPDGRNCPATEDEWRELIEARRLTLGLPEEHPLSPFEHDVFLPAPSP